MWSSSRCCVLRLACLALLVAVPALAQIDPKNVFLEQTGWDELRAGRYRTAADAFREAIARDPKNARLHLGAGIAAYLAQRNSDAQHAFERALELDSTLTEARSLLGRVLYRQGDLTGAIRIYEALTSEAAGDMQAQATLERWRREWEVHVRMQQTVDTHFTVSFEGTADAALASAAIEVLERAYWRVGGTLEAFPSSWTPVVLYTGEQFRDITRAPSWAAGAYDGTIRIPVRGALENARELDRVLAHEFTHALVHTLAPHGVPTWLNEGVATALESDDLTWAEDRVRKLGGAVPLAGLQSSFSQLTSDQVPLAYATSALAVRQLLEQVGGFALANLLRDLGEGAEFETAFTRHAQQSFSDFERGLTDRYR